MAEQEYNNVVQAAIVYAESVGVVVLSVLGVKLVEYVISLF